MSRSAIRSGTAILRPFRRTTPSASICASSRLIVTRITPIMRASSSSEYWTTAQPDAAVGLPDAVASTRPGDRGRVRRRGREAWGGPVLRPVGVVLRDGAFLCVDGGWR